MFTLAERPGPDDTVHLVTEGLAAHGHPELVVPVVPPAWLPYAREALTFAGTFATQSPLAPRSTLAYPTMAGQFVLRLEEWDVDPSLLALVDLSDIDETCPFIALATLWGTHAMEAIGRGETEAGITLLRAAIDAQPVLGTEREPDIVYLYNWDGAMNLLLLAALTDDDAPLREAFRRSPATELRTLGDPIDDLRDLDAATLAHQAAMLVTSQFAHLQPIAGGETAAFTGPLAAREGPLLVLDRSVVSLPVFVELTSHSVMDTLYDDATHQLAADVVLALGPMATWLATLDAQAIHHERPHATHTHTAWQPGMRLVSYVLADIARLVAMGAVLADLRAWFGLEDDPEAHARVAEAAARFAALA